MGVRSGVVWGWGRTTLHSPPARSLLLTTTIIQHKEEAEPGLYDVLTSMAGTDSLADF